MPSSISDVGSGLEGPRVSRLTQHKYMTVVARTPVGSTWCCGSWQMRGGAEPGGIHPCRLQAPGAKRPDLATQLFAHDPSCKLKKCAPQGPLSNPLEGRDPSWGMCVPRATPKRWGGWQLSRADGWPLAHTHRRESLQPPGTPMGEPARPRFMATQVHGFSQIRFQTKGPSRSLFIHTSGMSSPIGLHEPHAGLA